MEGCFEGGEFGGVFLREGGWFRWVFLKGGLESFGDFCDVFGLFEEEESSRAFFRSVGKDIKLFVKLMFSIIIFYLLDFIIFGILFIFCFFSILSFLLFFNFNFLIF